MERKHIDCTDQADCQPFLNGADPAAWRTCESPNEEQKRQIRPDYQSHVVGTPGQPNTGTQIFPPEDPNWRVRSVGAPTQ